MQGADQAGKITATVGAAFVLPELTEREQLSRANGLIESFTYLAIILGTVLASALLHAVPASLASCVIIVTVPAPEAPQPL